MSFQPGDIIDGRYAVVRLLGKGGMGAVYLASEVELDRRVALKILLPEAARDPAARARFEREARAAAALQSDHVAKIFSVGILADGAPYIAMELLEGEDLAAALERRGRIPPAEAVRIVMEACDALGEAHALGIVHRDLKPSNIFCARRPSGAVTAKVLDFGISKVAERGVANHALTAPSALMGTPLYMSPEHVREARGVDARTDIWSLGVTLHELLTGQVPFQAESLAELYVAILQREPSPPSLVCPDVPPALDRIVGRCLAKDPGERFASARELAEALQAAPLAPGAGDAKTSASSERAAGATLRLPPAPPPESVPSALDGAAPDGADAIPGLTPPRRVALKGALALTPLGVLGVVVALRSGAEGGRSEDAGDAGGSRAETLSLLATAPPAPASVASAPLEPDAAAAGVLAVAAGVESPPRLAADASSPQRPPVAPQVGASVAAPASAPAKATEPHPPNAGDPRQRPPIPASRR